MRSQLLSGFHAALLGFIVLFASLTALPQSGDVATRQDERASAILSRAIARVGGDRYLQVRSQISRGKFSVMKAGALISFQSFLDVIVFPDRERTEFKDQGTKHIQVNTGPTGWVYDGDQELVKIQTPTQIANFRQSMRTSLDNLLRSHWKGQADLTYVGKRAATLGKRNDVLRLNYKDGFSVEFEFASDDALPQKALYTRTDASGEELKEEDRYAQFIDQNGIAFPFVVDRFTNGSHASRINFESIEINQAVPESIFEKPGSPKDARKDIKLGGK
jgi:hypothetical protein